MKRTEALKLRSIIELAASFLDDKKASEAPTLFPGLRCDPVQTVDTPAIMAGTRICWRGQVKKAKVTLWDTVACNPDNAPDMWDDLDYRDGVRVIHENMSTTLAFSLGELGWWDGAVYKSKMAGNVFTPVTAPAQWELVG